MFATTSHADTHCPYLHKFIKQWAQIAPDSDEDPERKTKEGGVALTDDDRYLIRVKNLAKYPHIVATFFDLKMKLYIEHICKGMLDVNAWWCRYEWQGRGSTHMHYFLWLRNAPNLRYLDDWVQEALESVKDGDVLNKETIDGIVADLNARALKAAGCGHDWAHGQCACAVPTSQECDNECPAKASQDLSHCKCDCRATRDARWWADRCTRLSCAWEGDARSGKPMARGDTHPAAQRHWTESPPRLNRDDDASHEPADAAVGSMSATMRAELGGLTNACNRHKHTSYCLRRNKKTNALFCRFDFPKKVRQHNGKGCNFPHFYCERVKGGVRWKLYLPNNDPLLNMITLSLWAILRRVTEKFSKNGSVIANIRSRHDCDVHECTHHRSVGEALYL